MKGSVIAIVAAAGIGKRLGGRTPKPFVRLGGVPLVLHALRTLDASPRIDGIVIAVERSHVGHLAKLVRRFRLTKVVAVVAGGATRTASVRRALAAVPPCGIVLIQDAARPFLEPAFLDRTIAAARRYGGAIVAVPESDTVKLAGAGSFVQKTLDRKQIFRAQTPQAFTYDLIMRAYRRPAHGATDDANLVERMGRRVAIVAGSYRNIKVTTKEDLAIAEALI